MNLLVFLATTRKHVYVPDCGNSTYAKDQTEKKQEISLTDTTDQKADCSLQDAI